MSLWDSLPAEATNGGALDGLRPLLESASVSRAPNRVESDGTWEIYNGSVGGAGPLTLDPSTGAFTRNAAPLDEQRTPIEFPDPNVTVELGLRLRPDGTKDGTVRAIVGTPSAILKLRFLRGAELDAQGQLKADLAKPNVRITLPALRVQFLRPAGQGIGVKLLAAAASGPPVDQIYEFITMDPPYALIGPGNVVGFAFRSAVLDLSGTAGPNGVPAEARALPGDWQGLYLPEARLFIAPSGLEGIAVSGGVRNLWVGIGRHAGVTGIFEAEVVNRGSAPQVRLRFQSSTGEWIGVPDIDDPTRFIDLPDDATLYVDAGGGLAPYTYEIKVGSGAVVRSDRTVVALPASASVGVSISVRTTDASAKFVVRTIAVRRRAAAIATPPSGGGLTVATTTTTTAGIRIEIVSQDATGAVLRLSEPGGTVNWTWPGGSVTGATATVPVGSGSATVNVLVTRSRAAGETVAIDAYMLFSRPNAAEGVRIFPASNPPTPLDDLVNFADNPDNVRTQPANARSGFPSGGSPLLGPELTARLSTVPAGTVWTVEGWASYEGDDSVGNRQRNQELSRVRRDVLVRILQRNGFAASVTPGAAHGHGPALARGNPDPTGPALSQGSGQWWRARATTVASSHSDTVTGVITRAVIVTGTDPMPVRDPEPTRQPVPDCFRKIGMRVELVRGTFVRLEIYGEFDMQTAAEQRIAASKPGATVPPRTNLNDGIAVFLLRLRIAEDRSSWDTKAEFRAIEQDIDGLAKISKPAGGDATGVNILGAVAALSPLLAAATPANPTAGELVPMIVLSGAAVAIGAAGVLKTEYVMLRGGELVMSDGLVDPATGKGTRRTQVSVMLDVETSFTFDLGFIKVDPAKPLTTRYKAVGVRSTWESRPRADGTVEYVPLPVFDPSRGYKLDIPTGSLIAASPLGEVLRILGASMSRDNPTYLEVEVGMGVDLGIVTVDTVRVRLRLDAAELPQITKLGATIDVPGTLHGTGYVQITDAGFKGAFDLTITPLNMRASAQLAVETKNGVTGVLIGAEVQFPVPLPLGNSGLGLFGFLGGVGVNYQRLENPSASLPALAWLQHQLSPPRNSVMHPDGWQHTPGAYAFAAGVLLGTAEGGFVVHLKGIVLIEVPGPRVLLVMKADVLKLPPVLKQGDSNATFLAMLDLDFGRGTITIGLIAEYSIVSLLKVRVPVTAFFNMRPPAEWLVDLGTFSEPVTVQILDVFSGTGYLMVHSNGINPAPAGLPVSTSGLTIAVGFHLQCVLMGSKSVGLYLEVAGGFDAIVALDPLVIAGKIYVRGELRLFIIGISASAELTVLVGRQRLPNNTEVERTYVHGEVCGKVDFFFFSVKGCVSLTLGDSPPPPPIAAPLVAGVKLVSRSPALIEGAATDRALDGVLADALNEAQAGSTPMPSVPLDAVPVILFNSPPSIAGGNVVLGGVASGTTGLTANPWVRNGDAWWRYEIVSVEMIGALQPAPPAGKTPAAWWNRGSPADPKHGPALALLSWLPTPFSRAMPTSTTLTESVTETWGHICSTVAPPARVLWTFDQQGVGPSAVGWTLEALPWPDALGTLRSIPVSAPLKIIERWRCGDAAVDLRDGTDPAYVIGDVVPCPDRDFSPITKLEDWAGNQPLTFSRGAMPMDDEAFALATQLLAKGVSLPDLSARFVATAWDPALTDGRGLKCSGRLLRSPDRDDGQPGSGGDEADKKFVDRGWAELGFKPGELANSVVLRLDDAFADFSVLLMLERRSIELGVFLVFRDAAGREIGRQRVLPSDVVSAARPLPASWTFGGAPWADAVERAGRIAARIGLRSKKGGFVLAYVKTDTPKDCVEIEIGEDRSGDNRRIAQAAFYILAMESALMSEVWRFDWDSTTQSESRSALITAVTQHPDDHALLVPGTGYTVSVKWRAEFVKSETQPAITAPPVWGPVQEQKFFFTADSADRAPAFLDPWILCSAPSMGDAGIFWRDPIRIALSSQKVVDLFRAYNEELRVVVRSASGRHPPPPGGGARGASVTLPVGLTPSGGAVSVTDAGAVLNIMTPWQEAVTELLDSLPCTPDSGSRTYPVLVTLLYELEPLTDYILDIAAVPIGSPEGTAGRRVYRVNFTTSRFGALEEMAKLVRYAAVEPGLISNPSGLASLAAKPLGNVLDNAFVAAGLGVPEAPRYPRVQVLWSGDAIPQPVAVVVECSEPLWRQRPMPAKVSGPTDATDPLHTWWKAIKSDWLAFEVSSRAPVAGAPPRANVIRLVHAPGSARAVALLAPNARGRELVLDLVVKADLLAGTSDQTALALSVLLARAPWEVED